MARFTFLQFTLKTRRTMQLALSVFLCLAFSETSYAQYSITQCQDQEDALLGTDRNDWSHANLAVVNEAYLHNFDPVDVPCGLETASLSSVEVTISITSIAGEVSCTTVPVFGNVMLNCPLSTTSVCPIQQDVLTPGCAFGGGQSFGGTHSLVLNTCGTNPTLTDVVGVDIIPATELVNACATTDSALSDAVLEYVYTVCVTYTFSQDLPEECENTTTMSCDDGDPCTINDEMTVETCDTDEICVPCAGVLSADCDQSVSLPCDDNDPCTINDEVIVSACDNTIVCEPCSGELVSSCASTIDLPCDDGDDCTENDVERVNACDDTEICEPCQGTPVTQCTSTVSLPCDDGDDCTENDVEILDACDNTIVCAPCAGELVSNCDETSTLPCDDGDPCTVNDILIVSACDNTVVCAPCLGMIQADCSTTAELPCDDGDPCTVNDVVVVSACDDNLVCLPCQGIAADDCSSTIALPCDDGDDCTENDVELYDACDYSILCAPCQGTTILPSSCDDGDCSNGVEVWDPISCECTTVATIDGCTDPSSCNYDSLANCDNGCDYSCLDCLGVPYGDAIIDDCEECVSLDDPLKDISCLDLVYVPTAFTPDGDGANDYFSVQTGRPLADFDIQIFDRFGQEVFSSQDVDFRWAGSLNDGDYYSHSQIYVYLIKYSFDPPTVIQKTGTVSLIR